MKESKLRILMEIDADFLVNFSYMTGLLRPKKYFTKQDFVNGLSRKLNIEQCRVVRKLDGSGVELDTIVKKFLTEMNSNANTVRRLYVDHLLSHKIKNVQNDIVFFEFRVDGSRTDITRVNGRSYAFEIKSGRDRPDRAMYQIQKFSDVFECVSLIVNDEKRYKFMPDNVGIIEYEYSNGEMKFTVGRDYKRNLELNVEKQLKSLPTNQLIKILNGENKKLERAKMIQNIIEQYSEEEINSLFKLALKDNYYGKWLDYIKNNFINS
jgi:hypothetical protein